MPYIAGMRKHGVVDRARFDNGFERFRSAVGNLPVVTRGKIPAANAFGICVSVFYPLMAVSN